MTTDTTMLAAALQYASIGWAVIPLHTPTPAGCSCRHKDCTSVGKHPRTQRGLTDASTDPEKITSWWSMWPQSNVGIVCGPSGIVAIDVDPRHGGDDDWHEVKRKYGKECAETVSSHTGGGGEHYIYQQPAGCTIGNVSSSDRFVGPLGRGIDVRAAGGYIVAPPSLHASGALYEWYEGESPFDRKPALIPLPLLEVLDTPTRLAEHEPISAADILKGVAEGGRDHTLFQLASKLRYADVPIDWAYKLVGEAAARCTPPFPAPDARKKVDSAYRRYEPGKGAFVEPDEDKHDDGVTGRVDLWLYMSGGVKAPDWTIPGVLVAGMVTLLHGEPGCGKTILALYYARELVRQGIPVLFVDEESGPPIVASRLILMGLTEQEVALLHYYPFAGFTLADAQVLAEKAEEIGAGAVIFDSMADVLSASDLDENAAADVTKWMVDIAVRIARKTAGTPAVLILDHNTKSQETVKYARGSGAKKAKADIAFFVNKVAEFDAQTMGRVRLERTKNRPGYVPENVAYEIGGKDGALVVEPFDISRHDILMAHPKDPAALVALKIAGSDGLGNVQIQGVVGFGATFVTGMMTRLEKAGCVARVGAGRGTKYVYLKSPAGDYESPARESESPAYSPTNPPSMEGDVGDYGNRGRKGKSLIAGWAEELEKKRTKELEDMEKGSW